MGYGRRTNRRTLWFAALEAQVRDLASKLGLSLPKAAENTSAPMEATSSATAQAESKTEEDVAEAECAYLLFYQRRS